MLAYASMRCSLIFDLPVINTLNQFLAKPEARLGLLMAVFLSIFVQFTGLFLLMQFAAPIFAQSGSNLAPNDAAIVTAGLQIVGNLIPMLLIDKFGRKVWLPSTLFVVFNFLVIADPYSLIKLWSRNVVCNIWHLHVFR